MLTGQLFPQGPLLETFGVWWESEVQANMDTVQTEPLMANNANCMYTYTWQEKNDVKVKKLITNPFLNSFMNVGGHMMRRWEVH